ncbi:MAG: FAD-dependent oxidoreductase [Thermodesulfobacteriota bacterium]
MKSFDYDMGVLGGGAAGLTVAAGAASLGAKTLLAEKEENLGGDCLHYGCVPSKTLIATARAYHAMKNGERFGLPKVDPPAPDFSRIAARIRGVIAKIQVHDSHERFRRLGAEVVRAEPLFADEHTVDLGDRKVTARHWVVATGSSAVVPGIEGPAGISYLTNREIFSLQTLPGSLLILGGGPIGVEMAQAFSRLGTRVAVVEMADRILAAEDPDMAGEVARNLSAEGVALFLGCKAVKVAQEGGKKLVTVEAQDKTRQVLSADEVLVAVGRRPNTAGLGLEKIGLGEPGRPIVVDARMRTKIPHIFAAGDAVGGYMFTHAAGYEGGIALTNAVLRLPRKADYSRMCWCTYTDPELASIGMNESAAKKAGVPFKIIVEDLGENDRSLAEGNGSGKLKLLLDKSDKPLGVQILAPHAGDLLAEWVAVMGGGVKLSALAGAIHPYPTMAEASKKAAADLFAPRLYSDNVRKALRFLFQLKGRAPLAGAK